MQHLILLLIFTIFSLNIFALDSKKYTVQELGMDSIINEILLEIENNNRNIIGFENEDTISIKSVRTYYVSTGSAELFEYSSLGSINNIYTLDSVYVPEINNKPLFFYEFMGVKYTISIYNNQFVLFKDNECVSSDELISFTDTDILMLKGKNNVLISPDFKNYKVIGAKTLQRVKSKFFSSYINYSTQNENERFSIHMFDCKTWESKLISSGMSPQLTFDNKNLLFIYKNKIDYNNSPPISNDNVSVYNLSTETITSIFEIPDSLYTFCEYFDNSGDSEIFQCNHNNKNAFKMTVTNKTDCEKRDGLRYYDYYFDENGILEVSCYYYDNGNKKIECK